MPYRFILIAIFATLVAGCSDPKAANEKNFKAVIQDYLDKTYPKCYITTNFPVTIEYDIGGAAPKIRALAKVGLVSERVGSREIVGLGGGKRSIPAPVFDLTDQGKRFYTPAMTGKLASAKIGGFCLGKAVVDSVTQFTEPADMFGQRISRVSYTYEVSGFPAWARSPEVLSTINGLKADVESDKTPIKRLETLILTNNGWVHQHLFR